MDYSHVNCDSCGGIIKMDELRCFYCENCGKEFALHHLDYDRLMINSKTGWIFPVLDKKNK